MKNKKPCDHLNSCRKRHLTKHRSIHNKNFQKTKSRKNILNLVKDIHENSTPNISLNGKRLKTFLLISETRQGCVFLPLLFTIVLEILARTIKQGKRDERHKDLKGKYRTFYSRTS